MSLLPGNVQAIADWANNAKWQGAADGEGLAGRDGGSRPALRAASAKGDDDWGWLPPVI